MSIDHKVSGDGIVEAGIVAGASAVAGLALFGPVYAPYAGLKALAIGVGSGAVAAAAYRGIFRG